jgi:hypothetical protein
MTDNGERRFERRSGSFKFPITPRTLPKLIRLGWALRKADKAQDLEAEHPSLVMFDEHSSALIERARGLAGAEREDQAAVGELAALAKGRRRALRVAALGTRQHGAHLESSLENLAHRLLQAAIAGAAVEPLSGDERKRLEQIDAFTELPRQESWRVLTEREPRLAELEADAGAGRFGGRDLGGELCADVHEVLTGTGVAVVADLVAGQATSLGEDCTPRLEFSSLATAGSLHRRGHVNFQYLRRRGSEREDQVVDAGAAVAEGLQLAVAN